MEYTYAVASKITADADLEKGTSKLIAVDVELFANKGIDAEWRKEDGVVNEAGLKAQTQALIQGLVANIHWGHQMEYRDSAEHLRYIIEHLEKGFKQATVETTIGKF